MGIPLKTYVEGRRVWCCANCQSHLASHDSFISSNFTGRLGHAKLFSATSNVLQKKQEKANMNTGCFLIREIQCQHCHEYVGWTYVKSFSPSECYKEGKFILEGRAIVDSRELVRELARDTPISLK